MQYSLNSEKIMLTPLGDEAVLYDIENNDYVSVNETLYQILQRIEKGLSSEEIIDQLSNAYLVTKEQCETEVTEVLNTLLKKGYIL